MGSSSILPFATATGANVLTPDTWSGRGARLTGFVNGVADPQEVNMALRQASFVAAAMAQFVANKAGVDVPDDGNLSALEANIGKAVVGSFGDASLVHFGFDQGTANALAVGTVTPAVASKDALVMFVVHRSIPNTGPATITVQGTLSGNIVRTDGSPVQGGDLGVGPSVLTYVGNRFVLLTGVTAAVALLTPSGAKRVSSFTPNVVIADIPNPGTDYVAQYINFSGATYIDLTGTVAIRNQDPVHAVGYTAWIRLLGVGDAQYIGGIGKDNTQTPFFPIGRFNNLNPAQGYTAQMIVRKDAPYGPTSVLDSYLLGLHNGN